jgi:O-antigen/teichoic acid export membrane protein
MLSMMGVATIGIREIAATRDYSGKCSKAFSSLIALNAITTVIAIIILFVISILIQQLRDHAEMMLLGAFKLIFNFLLIEWFYRGIEQFKYITIRSIIVKTLYVVSVFLFVKTPNDYYLYYLISVVSIAINSIINLSYVRNFTRITFTNLEIRPIIKPFFIVGLYSLLTSMYTTFNVTYLGFVAGDTQVGYYTTATKLYGFLLAFFSAFTGVLMPRMSKLIADGEMEKFKNMISKSFSILFSFAIPSIIFAIIYAPQIILLIAGEGYEGSIIPMRIVMPLVLIIGYEQILVIQTLMPLRKDTIIFRNSVIGAILGILLNITLVNALQSIGSAIVWVICELSILILSQISVYKEIKLNMEYKQIIKDIILYIPLCIILYFITSTFTHEFYKLCIAGTITLVYFISVQYIFYPNEIITQACNKLIRQVRI